jgi:hypothetical protein
MRHNLEEQEQIALMNWASLVQVGPYRLQEVLAHYPAGGYRTRYEAGRFKAMGVQSGLPDLLLFVPAGPYACGWWELKAGRNKPTDKQLEQHAKLRALGHYVQTYWHWAEAAADMVRYLEKGSMTIVVRARL